MVQNNEKGTTMLETILYISFLFMLGSTIYSNISKGVNRYKTGRLTQQLVDLKKAIIQYTAVDEDFSNLSEEGMRRTSSMPIDMRQLRHALSGPVKFGPATEIATTTDAINKYLYYITFENLSNKACIEVITSAQFYTTGSEMDSVIINERYGWQYPFSHFDLNTSTKRILTSHNFSYQDVANACSEGAHNNITWIFS
ncbi:MAG: hypothetical protein IJZ30_03715 [Alphaproteobacteria bacterium]|nr:hypothetical protein [Alphaproteobacteria bacterium]